MDIAVVGTGYVGLVAGTCLADFGMNVTCIDKDEQKIKMLSSGQSPIYELGLTELIDRNMKRGRLQFKTDLKEGIKNSQVIFLAVGTPEGADGRPDLSQINQVAKQVARYLTDYKVIAIKSTVPVGTAKAIRHIINENLTCKVDFDVVSNPEFLREGAAINDFLHPDRIVIGSDSPKALEVMKEVYRPLYLLKNPFVLTTNETAEIIKYAANTMLATRISFMNEVANLCDKIGADVYDVSIALGMDKRIGTKFLHPGPGFGGSCFPKDVKGLVKIAEDNNYQFKLAQAVVEVNERQREVVLDKAKQAMGSFKGKKIGILGLSFKPNTDDIRESPAIYIAASLIKDGASVKAYDPAAMQEAKVKLPELIICENPYQVAEEAELIIIMTEWNEFRDLDLSRISQLSARPLLYDTRNIYDLSLVKAAGLAYLTTGRGDSLR